MGVYPPKSNTRNVSKLSSWIWGWWKKDDWYITNSKSVTCPRHFIKCSGLESSGFLRAGSAKISCLKARCQLTHRNRTTRPLLSTMCFPRVVSGKLTLLFQVLMKWNPKPFKPLEKPLANSSKQTRPTPGASSGQAPTAGATTEEWRELETTKMSTSLGRVNVSIPVL